MIDFKKFLIDHKTSTRKAILKLESAFWREQAYKIRDSLRKRVIKKAISKFSKYETIDSDRLHGVILSILLDKNTVCRDNSYGKISDYMTSWF